MYRFQSKRSNSFLPLFFVVTMLRVCPTKIVLKSEDLEEYNAAKQQWDETKTASASKITKEEQIDADTTTQHRQVVRSRIGIPK